MIQIDLVGPRKLLMLRQIRRARHATFLPQANDNRARQYIAPALLVHAPSVARRPVVVTSGLKLPSGRATVPRQQKSERKKGAASAAMTDQDGNLRIGIVGTGAMGRGIAQVAI
jgi:hypothetical protein